MQLRLNVAITHCVSERVAHGSLCFRSFLFLGAHSWGAEGVGMCPEHHGVASTPARSTFPWPIRFALVPSQLRPRQRNRQRHHQS